MNREAKQKLSMTVTLADEATIKAGTSIYRGRVTMISERGINVSIGIGVYFFKWENVLSIHQAT
jgi:hypothetical protein